VGDVFTVRLADGSLGFGQIADQAASDHTVCYFIALDHRQSDDEAVEPAKVAQCAVLLVVHSLDRLLRNRRWPIVGNAPVQKDILYPAFTRDPTYSGMKVVVDRWGNRNIDVPEQEASILPLEWTVTPIAFEKALNAKLGLSPWEERFDRMIPNYDRSDSRFF
jgi:hypothetical protein